MDQYGDVNGDETETSRDFKKILKIFYRWFKLGSRDHKQVGDPQETKGIRLKRPKDKITRENLVTEEDRTKLLHACAENLRDRAFIDVHLEAGTRPGEILSLQLKHVEFDKIGARIHVDGKTGARPIRLIRSTPNLAAWVNAHPFRDNPEAPLWILLDMANYGHPLTYVAAKAIVERRCRIAGIPKKVNLKLFRHSAATMMSKILTDAEMKKRQIGLQLQFVAAFSHFTSLGYELKAIDEGMQANSNGMVAGGLDSYYYFQKIPTQKS